jgi:two-component system OmpR family sensor kinase
LALLVAWRLARPLRRTADAAHALAAGHRDVVVLPQGPAEVAEVGEALNTLAAGLIQSEAREREFLLSVSHDLRTPLTAISGYAESLADGMIAPDRAPQIGAVMLAEAQRLGRLVADLLDLARVGAQEFRIDLIEVEITAFARSTAQVWAARCASEGVEFSLDCPPEPLLVRTDPTRLRQALDGLFDNALRITPAGAPIVLALAVLPPPVGDRHPRLPWVAIEVRDGGPGLTDADLGVAFDRSALYDRYRGVRQVGTGLGLAIVHGLVTRLGGTVTAGHAPEGGARFTVALPTTG